MPTRTTTFATNDVLTANDLNSLAGAWNSYTPTLTQSSAVTKTVTYAKYLQFGKLIIVQVELVATGAGTAGSAITVSLPVTAARSATAKPVIGSGFVNDLGTKLYPGPTALLTTTTVQIFRGDGTTTGGALGSDPSFALASGDSINLAAMYEAA